MCFYIFLLFSVVLHTRLSVADIDPSHWISKQSSHYTLEQSICYFSKNKPLLYINDLEERTKSGAIMILQVFLPSHILRLYLYVMCVCVCVSESISMYG